MAKSKRAKVVQIIDQFTQSDVDEARDFAQSMLPKADIILPYPAWYGWALQHAYLLGLQSGRKGKKVNTSTKPATV